MPIPRPGVGGTMSIAVVDFCVNGDSLADDKSDIKSIPPTSICGWLVSAFFGVYLVVAALLLDGGGSGKAVLSSSKTILL